VTFCGRDFVEISHGLPWIPRAQRGPLSQPSSNNGATSVTVNCWALRKTHQWGISSSQIDWNHQSLFHISWLVVLTCFNHLEKYEFVNGKAIIPYLKWEKTHVWNHQPVFLSASENTTAEQDMELELTTPECWLKLDWALPRATYRTPLAPGSINIFNSSNGPTKPEIHQRFRLLPRHRKMCALVKNLKL